MASAWAAVADRADSPVSPTTVATPAATPTVARTLVRMPRSPHQARSGAGGEAVRDMRGLLRLEDERSAEARMGPELPLCAIQQWTRFHRDADAGSPSSVAVFVDTHKKLR